MDYPGKLIRKTPLVPTQTSASGVWTMTEAMDAVKANTWPVAGTPLPMQQSLRFRRSASAYLNRTFGSPTNGTTWTFSYWAKLGIIGRCNHFAPNLSTNEGSISIESDYTLYVNARVGTPGGAGTNYFVSTSQVFRDPSSWYHIVVALDTTQATASNRVKIYVNGSQVTALANANYPPQNSTPIMGSAVAHAIGRVGEAGYEYYYDGLFGEMNYVDGQQLTPSSFGRTDPITGVWQAIPYTGTYGANGFYLPFKNPSNVGLDYSGNANNWTANNFSTAAGTVIQTFSTVGTTSWTAPTGVTSVSYLVVAGGGGGAGYGGDNVGGGGGGAGGLLTGTLSVTPGTAYTVTVGDGGGPSTNGSNSVFSSITATGGGKGGAPAAGNGGSGGGAGAASGSGAAIGTGTVGQGNNGGLGSGDWGTTVTRGGGGGGSGSVGGAASGSAGGSGGSGTASSISGTSVTYAAGGAGAIGNAVNGGTSGAANTGNGGQGRGGQGGGSAGSGGSGIVILSYSLPGAGTTYDVMADTPTQWLPAATLNGNANARGNYCVMNPLDNVGTTVSNGNLQLTANASSFQTTRSTFALPTGSWYCELTATSGSGNGSSFIGIALQSAALTTISGASNFVGSSSTSWSYSSNGNIYNNNGVVTATGVTWASGAVVGMTFDGSTLKFYKNGTLVTTVSSIPSGTYCVATSVYSSDAVALNFGQRPFSYTPPSGYLALNTYNMSTPTILQGNTVMDVSLWTGDGTNNRAITNTAGFKPDFVWIKDRSRANEHVLFNSTTGAGYFLESQATDPEYYNSTSLESFNSNGFTVGSSINWYVNYPVGDAFVGWQWQAGQGTTSSNTNGSITSTVNVNTSAGFSIVTYTGNGTGGATVGHGLGVAPSMIIIKVRSRAGDDWGVYHQSLGNTGFLALNTTAANTTSNVFWNSTSPTSSVFSIGTNTNVNPSGQTLVAYCWAEVAGFSKFGSYTGNGSTDGPFIYTGFRPKFILVKCSSTGGTSRNWAFTDSVRSYANVANHTLAANLTDGESSFGTGVDVFGPYNQLDLLSNGFKIRDTGVWGNASGGTYIYMAFAENPFKNALAR